MREEQGKPEGSTPGWGQPGAYGKVPVRNYPCRSVILNRKVIWRRTEKGHEKECELELIFLTKKNWRKDKSFYFVNKWPSEGCIEVSVW